MTPGAPAPTPGIAASDAIRWISIPAGSFEMGCSPRDTDCMPDELPRHSVELAALEMAETEATQAHYKAVMGVDPSGFAGCGDCPVEGLTWADADRFCRAVGGRLPTEAEWEYAARASATTRYSCGDDVACLDATAWFKANAGGATHPVRQKKPNAFGLYDMLGNVLEFAVDFYAEDAYAKSLGERPEGPGTGEAHVLRGGAWDFPAKFMRVSLRNHDAERIMKPAFRGVRCARDAKPRAPS
jgi:eukaryotic-like serine/threonine-protein kinase